MARPIRQTPALVLLALLFSATPGRAALLIAFTEEGGDVVARASGALNLAALTLFSTDTAAAFFRPDDAFVFSGGSASQFRGAAGPNAFGTGGITAPSSASGDPFGVFGRAGGVIVPAGYAGGPIAGSLTFAGTSFAALGLTPGSYRWVWGQGTSADSLTVQIGPVAVPGPGALTAFGLGLLALGAARRRSRP